MRAVEYDVGDFTCEMEFTDGITLQNLVVSSFASLFKALRDFNATVALATYSFVASNSGTQRYEYGFTAHDGRAWTQVIDFSTNLKDPGMTFIVEDLWPVSEFKFNRAVRDQIVILHQTLALEKFEATFVKA